MLLTEISYLVSGTKILHILPYFLLKRQRSVHQPPMAAVLAAARKALAAVPGGHNVWPGCTSVLV